MKKQITRYDMNSKGSVSGKTITALTAYQQAKLAGKTAVIVAKDEAAKTRICINHNVDPRDVVLKSDLTRSMRSEFGMDGLAEAIRRGAS